MAEDILNEGNLRHQRMDDVRTVYHNLEVSCHCDLQDRGEDMREEFF